MSTNFQARGNASGVKSQANPLQAISELNALAWSLRRQDPEKAMSLSSQAYNDAKALDSMKGIANSLLTPAFCYIDQANYDAAFTQLSKTKDLFTKLDDVRGLARVDLLYGLTHLRCSRFDEALESLFRSLENSRLAGAQETEALALTYAAEVYQYRSDYTLSLEYLDRANKLEYPDSFVKSELFLVYSRTYRMANEYKKALKYALEALDLKKDIKDKLGQAFVLNSLGLIYHDPEESEKALSYYLKGLKISNKLGDRRSKAALLGNIGELYCDLGDYENALDYTSKALELDQELNKLRGQGISYEVIGHIHKKMGEHETALENLQRSLEIRKEIQDKQGEASTLFLIAKVHYEIGQGDLVLDYCQQSLEIYRQVNYGYSECEILFLLAQVYSDLDKWDESEGYFEQALESSQKNNRFIYVTMSSEVLYEIHKEKGDFEQALAYFEILHAAHRQSTDEAVRRATKRMMVQFDLDNTRQEVEIQRLKTIELAEKNRKLKSLNIENAKLLGKLRDKTEQLQRLTEEDSLTGLYNRRYLEQHLSLEFQRAKRYKRSLSVVLIDIDHFKQINDQFSHGVGDIVLKTVSQIFKQTIRSIDIVARYGGEEFVLVLPETNQQEAKQICERVRRAVETYDWKAMKAELSITVSIGFSADLELENYEKLLSQADKKLYEAKRSGRNKVCG